VPSKFGRRYTLQQNYFCFGSNLQKRVQKKNWACKINFLTCLQRENSRRENSRRENSRRENSRRQGGGNDKNQFCAKPKMVITGRFKRFSHVKISKNLLNLGKCQNQGHTGPYDLQ